MQGLLLKRSVIAGLLGLLFLLGHLPTQPVRCGCTAERNCGCSCWQHPLLGTDHAGCSRGPDPDPGRACCRPADGPAREPSAPAESPATRRAAERHADWLPAERVSLDVPARDATCAPAPIPVATAPERKPLDPPPRRLPLVASFLA